uniref:MULE transposase domain-containing protein n=1 Tax=Lactuca sativa TaxID=4236 RepID=A0A9R1X8M6_LACSA|nr:hypothetical protein LSAT_V11C500292580 [Lactuca sativa]
MRRSCTAKPNLRKFITFSYEVRFGRSFFINKAKKSSIINSLFTLPGVVSPRNAGFTDVTYMTNKFKMHFAPFTGVNHHGQSILFGGALLANEKEETFEWLFEHFLKCMFGKYPKAIIIDQDKVMGNAIKKVFPDTRHRFCSWHIKKHETEHLRSYVSRYIDFQDMHRQRINSDTIEQFEATWEDMCIKYELESNYWLSDMYNQRIHWVKPFLKYIFFDGMTTTGRSESINSFFDGFVNSRTMLNEFVSQRAAEEDEDFKTMNSRPVLSSVHPIGAKPYQFYTRKMFDTVKKEWTEAITNLTHETITKTTEESTYRVVLHLLVILLVVTPFLY